MMGLMAAESLKPPVSVAVTVKLKLGVVSKSISSLSLTVISPVAAFIAKANLPSLSKSRLPEAKANSKAWLSESFAVTIPTKVFSWLFSGIEKTASSTIGGVDYSAFQLPK